MGEIHVNIFTQYCLDNNIELKQIDNLEFENIRNEVSQLLDITGQGYQWKDKDVFSCLVFSYSQFVNGYLESKEKILLVFMPNKIIKLSFDRMNDTFQTLLVKAGGLYKIVISENYNDIITIDDEGVIYAV